MKTIIQKTDFPAGFVAFMIPRSEGTGRKIKIYTEKNYRDLGSPVTLWIRSRARFSMLWIRTMPVSKDDPRSDSFKSLSEYPMIVDNILLKSCTAPRENDAHSEPIRKAGAGPDAWLS